MLGNIGSGKTLSAVKEMVDNIGGITYYTNIKPKKKKLTPWIKNIKPTMIVKKELLRMKKTGEAVFDFKLNTEFWRDDAQKPCTVVLDEFHSIMNPRRSMSKINIIVGDFIALLRRVIGEDPMIEGDLIIITQIGRRVESIVRDMAHLVKYHICHYTKYCNDCQLSWGENSEMPEKIKVCPSCGCNNLVKTDHAIEVFCFAGWNSFESWKEWGMNSYYKRYLINDGENYFSFYDTLQWDDMISELYQ